MEEKEEKSDTTPNKIDISIKTLDGKLYPLSVENTVSLRVMLNTNEGNKS